MPKAGQPLTKKVATRTEAKKKPAHKKNLIRGKKKGRKFGQVTKPSYENKLPILLGFSHNQILKKWQQAMTA